MGFLDFYRYKVKKTHSCGFSSICSRKPTLSTLITVGFLDFCQENPQMRDRSGNFSLAIFFKHNMNIQFQESRSMSRKYCKKTFTRILKNSEKHKANLYRKQESVKKNVEKRGRIVTPGYISQGKLSRGHYFIY